MRLGGSHRIDLGVRGNKARQLPPLPRRGRGWGLTCVVPQPPPARSLAIPSKAPEISVLSACGNVVWRKVAPWPRAPAPPPPGPPPPSPAPSSSPPSACAPRLPPSRTGRAAARPPEQTWNSFPVPLGRNLGQLRLEAASHSRSWSPGPSWASGSPGAGIKSWPDLERPPRGHGENLPQCLEQRLQRGWWRRTP